MISYAWQDIPVEFAEDGVAETRAVDAGQMTIAFERVTAGIDTRPLFAGLPDDACQSPHWGYVISGRLRVIGAGGERTISAGEAYYLAPGHNVVVEVDTELVEFSPAEARRATMEHAASQMAASA